MAAGGSPIRMTEAKSDSLDPELPSEAEATRQRPALSGDGDDLKTTRLPPLTPLTPLPPPAANLRPLPHPVPPAVRLSSSGESRLPAQKPSWLRALLVSTFPSPTTAGRAPSGGRADAPIRAQTAGAVYAGLGIVFAVASLVTGLRGAPSETLAPGVAAALVIARALIALGAGALSFAMFRQAERLLVQDPPPKS
jgi:hypothetical protein